MERDRFMSPTEAKEFGLIDNVLEHPPVLGQEDSQLLGETLQTTPPQPSGVSPSVHV